MHSCIIKPLSKSIGGISSLDIRNNLLRSTKSVSQFQSAIGLWTILIWLVPRRLKVQNISNIFLCFTFYISTFYISKIRSVIC